MDFKGFKLLRQFVSAFLVGYLTFAHVSSLSARVTGTQPARTAPDQWSVGRSGAEVTVDDSGNLIPTTDNDASLGTDALDWSIGYFEDLDADDDVAVGDDLTVTDDITADSITSTGLQVNTPTTYTIGAATEVTPTSAFGVFTTTGGALTWSCTNSCISTSVANGSLFHVMTSTTDNITLTDTATIQLSTTAASNNRVLSNPGDNLVLRLLTGVWYEVSFSTGHE